MALRFSLDIELAFVFDKGLYATRLWLRIIICLRFLSYGIAWHHELWIDSALFYALCLYAVRFI